LVAKLVVLLVDLSAVKWVGNLAALMGKRKVGKWAGQRELWLVEKMDLSSVELLAKKLVT